MKSRIEETLTIIADSLQSNGSIGLLNGEGGKLVFYSYLGKYLNTDKYQSHIEKSFENIFDKINTEPNISTTFCSGLAGVLWAIDHLRENELLEFDEDFSFFNPILQASIKGYTGAANFDFLHGTDGIIYYLNKRNVLTERDLNEWIANLYSEAIKGDAGYVWNSLLNIETGETAYNLSLSHGLSSKIIVLSEVYRNFPNNHAVKDLMIKGVTFLLNHIRDNSHSSLFPIYLKPEAIYVDRLAWCYGDLGPAFAIWRAGTVMNNPEWEAIAINILVHCAKRRGLTENHIRDAGLCHGTAGIAHIFNRVSREVKRPEFEEAKHYWLDETFKMAKHLNGIAGYLTWDGKTQKFISQSNLLEGVMGIGLSLLGFLSEDAEAMNWDESLLLSN